MKVLAAVVSYRRPAELARLLDALTGQAADLDPPAVVVVVDNDPEQSARDVVAAHEGVEYTVEVSPGIAAARNHAIDHAIAAGADALVFIDDDEVPSPGWLRLLVTTWSSSGADAVTGSVVSRFEVDPPAWVEAGGYFARRHRAGLRSGTTVSTAASNNLLLDLRVLRRTGLRFDADFGLSGGSDTLFSRALAASGGRIVWCPEAEVVEYVPAARLERRWLRTRAISYGTTDVRVALRLATGRRARAAARGRAVLAGAARVVGGLMRLLGAVVTSSSAGREVAEQTVLRGVGLVGGAVGYSYQRYRRPLVAPRVADRASAYQSSTSAVKRSRDQRS